MEKTRIKNEDKILTLAICAMTVSAAAAIIVIFVNQPLVSILISVPFFYSVFVFLNIRGDKYGE